MKPNKIMKQGREFGEPGQKPDATPKAQYQLVISKPAAPVVDKPKEG